MEGGGTGRGRVHGRATAVLALVLGGKAPDHQSVLPTLVENLNAPAGLDSLRSLQPDNLACLRHLALQTQVLAGRHLPALRGRGQNGGLQGLCWEQRVGMGTTAGANPGPPA